jgi:hypothetical protein
MVANRTQGRVLWFCDNLAELTGPQFIESYGGGVQFEENVLAVRERD